MPLELAGKWIAIFVGPTVEYRGQIIDHTDMVVLVKLYSQVTGRANGEMLFQLADLLVQYDPITKRWQRNCVMFENLKDWELLCNFASTSQEQKDMM